MGPGRGQTHNLRAHPDLWNYSRIFTGAIHVQNRVGDVLCQGWGGGGGGSATLCRESEPKVKRLY